MTVVSLLEVRLETEQYLNFKNTCKIVSMIKNNIFMNGHQSGYQSDDLPLSGQRHVICTISSKVNSVHVGPPIPPARGSDGKGLIWEDATQCL